MSSSYSSGPPNHSRCTWMIVAVLVAATLFLWWANYRAKHCSDSPTQSAGPSNTNGSGSGTNYPRQSAPGSASEESAALQRSALQAASRVSQSWDAAAAANAALLPRNPNNPNSPPPPWMPASPTTSIVSGEAYARQNYYPTMPSNVTPRAMDAVGPAGPAGHPGPIGSLPNGHANGTAGTANGVPSAMAVYPGAAPPQPGASPQQIQQALQTRYWDASTNGMGAPGSLGTVAACAGKPEPGSYFPYHSMLGQTLAVDSKFPNEQDPSSTLQSGCTSAGNNCPTDRNSAASQLNIMKLMPGSWSCGVKTPDPMATTNPDWSNLAPDRASFARAVTQQRTIQFGMNTRSSSSKIIGIDSLPFRKPYSAALSTTAMPFNDTQERLGLIMAATGTVPTAPTC